MVFFCTMFLKRMCMNDDIFNIERNRHIYYLQFTGPPRINIIQALYIIKAGNNVNISCVVRNVPENYKYTMYWNKGSHRITHYKYNPFLIIKIAKPNDAGNYSCHVENKYGKAHDSTEIKVLCEYKVD